jgi:hypothetical protein
MISKSDASVSESFGRTKARFTSLRPLQLNHGVALHFSSPNLLFFETKWLFSTLGIFAQIN